MPPSRSTSMAAESRHRSAPNQGFHTESHAAHRSQPKARRTTSAKSPQRRSSPSAQPPFLSPRNTAPSSSVMTTTLRDKKQRGRGSQTVASLLSSSEPSPSAPAIIDVDIIFVDDHHSSDSSAMSSSSNCPRPPQQPPNNENVEWVRVTESYSLESTEGPDNSCMTRSDAAASVFLSPSGVGGRQYRKAEDPSSSAPTASWLLTTSMSQSNNSEANNTYVGMHAPPTKLNALSTAATVWEPSPPSSRRPTMSSSSSPISTAISPPKRFNSVVVKVPSPPSSAPPLVVTTVESLSRHVSMSPQRHQHHLHINNHNSDDDNDEDTEGIVDLMQGDELGDGNSAPPDGDGKQARRRTTSSHSGTTSARRNRAAVVVLESSERGGVQTTPVLHGGGGLSQSSLISPVGGKSRHGGGASGAGSGGGVRRSSFGNGSATTMESSMLLLSGGRSEHTSLPIVSIESAKSVQNHRRQQEKQHQQQQRPPPSQASSSVLLGGSGSGGRHRTQAAGGPHDDNDAQSPVIQFRLPTSGRGIFSNEGCGDEDDGLLSDNDELASQQFSRGGGGPVNEWSMNASMPSTSATSFLFETSHIGVGSMRGTSSGGIQRRHSSSGHEQPRDLPFSEGLVPDDDNCELGSFRRSPNAAAVMPSPPQHSHGEHPFTRAVQRRAQEREEREQKLLRSRERQANAVERKMFLAEHRHLQLSASWLTFVELARSMKRLAEVASIAKRLGERRRRRGINPIIGLRLRQLLRRARTRLQGRGVPRPTVAMLRADKLLNLFPDAQLQHAIDRMTLKYFFENENIIMMGSEDDEAYVLHSGVADVLMGDVKVFTMRSGMCFGTVGMISGEPRTASIVARERDGCLAWVLTRAVFSGWGGGAEDTQKIAAAHAAINELRQQNMMNVYKKQLDPSTLGYYPMLSGVAHETLTSITTTSTRPRVVRAGTVLSAPNAPLTQSQPFILLRGSVCVKVDQKSWAGRANSYYSYPLHEQLRMLYDVPQRKPRGGGVAQWHHGGGDGGAANGGSFPKQPHHAKDFTGTTVDVLLAAAKEQEQFAEAYKLRQQQLQQQSVMISADELNGSVAPTTLTTAQSAHGNQSPAQQQDVQGPPSKPTATCFLFEVHAPALFQIAPLFLAHAAAPPFTVEALTDCDLLGIGRENLRGQDVLELATLRQNALNLHCDFVRVPSRAEFAKILCSAEGSDTAGGDESGNALPPHPRRGHASTSAPPSSPSSSVNQPAANYFASTLTAVASKLATSSAAMQQGRLSVIKIAASSPRKSNGAGAAGQPQANLADACPYESFVYGANDYLTFDPQSDFKIHIVLSGEIDPTSFRGGRTSVEAGGGPFVWPPMAFAWFGTRNLVARTKTQLDTIRIERKHLIAFVCREILHEYLADNGGVHAMATAGASSNTQQHFAKTSPQHELLHNYCKYLAVEFVKATQVVPVFSSFGFENISATTTSHHHNDHSSVSITGPDGFLGSKKVVGQPQRLRSFARPQTASFYNSSAASGAASGGGFTRNESSVFGRTGNIASSFDATPLWLEIVQAMTTSASAVVRKLQNSSGGLSALKKGAAIDDDHHEPHVAQPHRRNEHSASGSLDDAALTTPTTGGGGAMALNTSQVSLSLSTLSPRHSTVATIPLPSQGLPSSSPPNRSTQHHPSTAVRPTTSGHHRPPAGSSPAHDAGKQRQLAASGGPLFTVRRSSSDDSNDFLPITTQNSSTTVSAGSTFGGGGIRDAAPSSAHGRSPASSAICNSVAQAFLVEAVMRGGNIEVPRSNAHLVDNGTFFNNATPTSTGVSPRSGPLSRPMPVHHKLPAGGLGRPRK